MNLKIIGLSIAGSICLLLGAIGLLIPVWPTTPFVIVSAACFSCTPTIRNKLMSLPFFGEHINNYEKRKGLTKKTVIVSLTFLWSMLALSCVMIKTGVMMIILPLIGIAVTVHILWVAKPKGNSNDEK